MSETVLALDSDFLAARFSAVAGAPVFVAGGSFIDAQSSYVEERQLVTNAVATRQAEFYSGRHYARAALKKAGGPLVAILRGDKGDPLWPPGFIGAITHDGKQAIAMVARDETLVGVGLDLVARPASVESHLQSLIANDMELSLMAQLYPAIPPLAACFSCKESVVKAVSPGINHYLDLTDIALASRGEHCVARILGFELSLTCFGFPASPAIMTFASLRR